MIKTIFLAHDLMNAIAGRKIIINNNGVPMEVTEKSFLDGIDLNRNDFEVTMYYIKSGDSQIAVIRSIRTMPKQFARIDRLVVRPRQKWYKVAASLLS